MRMSLAIFILFLAPVFLCAQHIHVINRMSSPGSHLLNINENIVLIDEIDITNGAQTWTTFDNSMNVISTKKLVTPSADMLINQTYLPGDNKVLRIDQMVIEKQLHIGAFVFDTKGTLLHVKEIEISPAPGTSIINSPFVITQSPDKKSLALVQSQSHQTDSLAIASIILDDALEIVNNSSFIIHFETILNDMQFPLLSNNQELLISITDKFDSYKLSADIKGYLISKSKIEPTIFQLNFDRKKLKNINLSIANNNLNVAALYSNSNDKGKIAGVINTSYNWVQQQKTKDVSYAYSPQVVKELKKAFGVEGRRGHLPNFLSPLPTYTNNNFGFASLLPDKPLPPRNKNSEIPPALEGLGAIKQNMDHVNSLVGTTPNGSTKPLTLAEATTYAATMQRGTPYYIVNTDDYYKNPNKGQDYSAQSQKIFKRNLLFFSFDNEQINNQFVKLVPIQDDNYNFFAYVPESDGYSALHYVRPSFKRSYLNKTTIDKIGKVSEKNVFEDKSKILLTDYPYIVTEKMLLAFYEDKLTGEMGLAKIQL